jgi:HAD superfamily hydrolase (TIGR01662 family)
MIERLFIFDADATLRRCTVKDQGCPNRPGEWEAIPWAKERLATIDWTRNGFGIASNQGGVAHGYLTPFMACDLLTELALDVLGPHAGLVLARPGTIRICPHGSRAGCDCRKPAPKMLQEIMTAWGVGPDRTIFVGDLESDQGAALAAGCEFSWAWDFCGRTADEWTTWLAERAGEKPIVGQFPGPDASRADIDTWRRAQGGAAPMGREHEAPPVENGPSPVCNACGLVRVSLLAPFCQECTNGMQAAGIEV